MVLQQVTFNYGYHDSCLQGATNDQRFDTTFKKKNVNSKLDI